MKFENQTLLSNHNDPTAHPESLNFPNLSPEQLNSLGPLPVKLVQMVLPFAKFIKDRSPNIQRFITAFDKFRTNIGEVDKTKMTEAVMSIPSVGKGDLAVHTDKLLGNASIAVVYEGSSRQMLGKKLAVKVIKPEGKKKLDDSFKQLEKLISVTSGNRDQLKNFALTIAKSSFQSEFDTNAEMRALERLRNCGIRTPKVYGRLSSENAIVMDKIENSKALSEFVKDATPKQKRKVAGRYLASIIRMFRHGYIHGDPHSGNVLVGKKNRLYWIDPSPAVEFSADKIFPMINLLKGIRNGNRSTTVDSWNKLSSTPASKSRIGQMKREYAALTDEEFYIKLINEGPVFNPDYVTVARSLIETAGTMIDLLPEKKGASQWLFIITKAFFKSFSRQ